MNDMDGRKRDVPEYLPDWPDFSNLNTRKKRRRSHVHPIGLAVIAVAALLLWHVDPLVVIAFLAGLSAIRRRSDPPQ